MADRQIRAVFANYKVKRADGGLGLKSAARGTLIDTDTLADGELERLEANGALMAEGGEVPADRLEEALMRALNPTDVLREDIGPSLTVSPPPLGAAPIGSHTKGDTGVNPEDQPAPMVGESTRVSSAAAEQEALDRLRRDGEGIPRTDAPDVEDTAALSEFIKTGGDAGKPLTAPEVVALAENDADRARFVLEAEKAASGQDPRATVEKPLLKIIEGAGGQ